MYNRCLLTKLPDIKHFTADFALENIEIPWILKKISNNMWKSITLYYTNKLKRHFAKTVQHKNMYNKTLYSYSSFFSKNIFCFTTTEASSMPKLRFSYAISKRWWHWRWKQWIWKVNLKRSENATSIACNKWTHVWKWTEKLRKCF